MEQNIDFFKGKKILITGGGGYLGSKLASILAESEAFIALIDLSFNTSIDALCNENTSIKKFHTDITDKEAVETVCNTVRPDYIYHFAARLNRERDFNLYPMLHNVNVIGTLNLLEGLKHIKYLGFYFSSTSEVYGNIKSPFQEDQIPSPASPYSLSKFIAENLIKTYSELNHKPYTILRIFNFFGPGMPESFFLNQLIETFHRNEVFEMTGGEQIRDFIHIDDLISSLIALTKSEKGNGEIINISSGKGVMLKKLAMEIAGKYKKESLLKIGALPYRDNEVWEMIGDNRKLMSMNVNYQFPVFEEKLESIIQL